MDAADSLRDVRQPRKLVEWFAGVSRWPVCRQTALLSALILLMQMTFLVTVEIALADTGIVNQRALLYIILGGALAAVISLIASLIALRLRVPGRWTAYLLVILYGAWIAVLVQAMGSWSTPHFAFYPVAVILVALYYGERVGWFAFWYGLALLVVREIFESGGMLPYAPVLLDRSLDSHYQIGWAMANAVVVMTTFVFCFFISVMVVATRRLQGQQLQAANLQLADAALQLKRSNQLISRYLPRQLVEQIVKGEHPEALKPERVKLVIFFSDVEGFTEASDQMDAEDLSEFLNEYLAEMSEIAERYSATINQFVGDGIMIFFGAPQATDDRDHAQRAVRMALEMQRRMQQLRSAWAERGARRPFRVRIGINTGYASVGDYGSPGRKVYSAVGIQTNLAARIQAHCEPGKVLVSDTTWALVREEFTAVDKGEFQFKGLHFPVQVYEISDAQTRGAKPEST